MAIFLDHVNVVLNKIRADAITSLSTDTSTEAYKAQIAVNRAIARVWNFKQWSFKRRKHTLSLTSGTMDYPTPKGVGEITAIRTNGSNKKLEAVDQNLFNDRVPDPTASGDPEVYTLTELVGYQTQITSTGVLSVVSSASDLTQKVLIKGTVSGQEAYEQVSLNGTTPVTTSNSFSAITSITKSDTTTGNITIKDVASTTLLTMGPLEKTLQFRNITFYPIPASSLTATIHSFGLAPQCTHAYEDSQIPSRWDYVVEQWGIVFALQGKGQDQLTELSTEMQLAIKMLEEDMASEEFISADEPIISGKAGDLGVNPWDKIPDGFGFTQSY